MRYTHKLGFRGVMALGGMVAGLLFAAVPAFAGNDYGFTGAFGSESSSPVNPDPLSGPAGVAVNQSSNDVYVVDKGNNRVEYFTATGSYIGQFNGSAAPTGALSNPQWVAVDNGTSSASKGDVYVTSEAQVAGETRYIVYKFSATGAYLGQLKETAAGSLFGELLGVAVNSAGDLWVHDSNGAFDEFSDTGSFLESFVNNERGPQPGGLAIDSAGIIYAVGGEALHVLKFDAATGAEVGEISSGVSSLAIDPATNGLFVGKAGGFEGKAGGVEQYGPFGEPFSEPLDRFGATRLMTGASGVGVESSTGTIYAADASNNDVDIFAPGVGEPPVVLGESATGLTSTSEKLEAKVNPNDQETTYEFEYAAEAALIGTPAATTVAGATALPAVGEEQLASVNITGLQQNTPYFYRVVTTNGPRSEDGPVETFAPLTAPVITVGEAQGLTANNATLQGTVDPEGAETSYHYEYIYQGGYEAGLASGAADPYVYGASTPEIPVGSEKKVYAADAPLTGLAGGTTYHYALVATNTEGTKVVGPDQTFTTSPAPPVPPTPGTGAGGIEPAPPATQVPSAVFPLVPYTPISQLDAREAKEGKATTPTTKTKKCKAGYKKNKAGKCVRKPKKKAKRKGGK
jgi:NHL repeat